MEILHLTLGRKGGPEVRHSSTDMSSLPPSPSSSPPSKFLVTSQIVAPAGPQLSFHEPFQRPLHIHPDFSVALPVIKAHCTAGMMAKQNK